MKRLLARQGQGKWEEEREGEIGRHDGNSFDSLIQANILQSSHQFAAVISAVCHEEKHFLHFGILYTAYIYIPEAFHFVAT